MLDNPKPDRRPIAPRDWHGAARTVATVCGAELLVARLTAQAVTPHDVGVSLLAWLVVGILLALFVWLFSGLGARGAMLGAVAARSPVVVIAACFLLPIVVDRPVAMAAAVLFLLGTVAVPLIARRRGFPRAPEVLSALAGAAALAFVLDGRGWPVLSVYAPFAVLWLVPAALVRHAPAALLCAGIAAAASMVAEPVHVRWGDALPPARAKSPDVYLLTLDTLRRDVALEMKSFRALAAKGVLFDNLQSSAPWTLPSMATIMTGKSPAIHGAFRTGGEEYLPIGAEVRTLASGFRELGYDTASVAAANPNVGQRFGFRTGFETFDHALASSVNPLPRGFTISDLVRPLMARVLRRRAGLNFWNSDVIVDRGLQVLESRRERPLFVWMHFMDCHTPYDRVAKLPPDIQEKLYFVVGSAFSEFYRGRPDRRSAVRTAYVNEARYLDASLMRFLERIDRDSSRPAIVVMVADHGEDLFERNVFGHGHSFHEELIGVPLVIRGLPGVVPGERVEDLVGAESLYPALLSAAAGLADSAVNDLLRPDPERVHFAFNQLYPKDGVDRAAGRRGRWKALFEEGRPVALFDLEEDPGERVDVLSHYPEIAESLGANLPDLKMAGSVASELSESDREALRQLGY